jgi:hypothetical protein
MISLFNQLSLYRFALYSNGIIPLLDVEFTSAL